MKAAKQQNPASIILASRKQKLTLYDARRALGKELSDELSDVDLMRLISDCSYLIECSMARQSVPQNSKVMA